MYVKKPNDSQGGKLVGNSRLDQIDLSNEQALSIFRFCLLTRMLDNKLLSLQRQGRIGPYIPCQGEEAVAVASTFALERHDWIIPAIRELGAYLVRGISLDLIIAQVYANRNDIMKGRQASNCWGSKELNIVPIGGSIGSYLPMAVGIGLAAKFRREHLAVLTYFSDGGTSSSDFHTAMNFAGVNSAPVVFFCRNNGWAISTPTSKQTASESLAIKSIAYGFEGIQIDGNNVSQVYSATKLALEKARKGGGPTLIEAVTYRMGPHTTSDDPSRYRDTNEVKEWAKRDAIDRLRKILVSKGIWDENKEKEIVSEFDGMISKSIERQEAAKPLPVSKLFFDDVYAQVPWFLEEERRDLMEITGRNISQD